jgi:two-component system, NtrC family, nitrogen regulation sensor histidine kinase NtrY
MSRWWHIWNEQRPPLPADEVRRRRREVLIIAATAAVFLAFALFETRLPRFSNSSSLSGNLTFFFLINLNLILLVLLVFLVTRNLVKLVFERRHHIFGSRLRARLALAFVAFTIFPTIVLFLVAEGFLSAAFENWFNVRVESSLKGSLDVAQSYYQFAANNALHFARDLGRQTDQQGLWSSSRRAELQRFAQQKVGELNLAGIQIFGPDGARLARADRKEVEGPLPDEPAGSLAELLGGQDITRTQRYGKGDIVRAGVPVHGADGKLLGGVMLDYIVPRNVSQRARDISRSYQEYRQLVNMKQPIKNGYILTLALITLVVVFSATWVGFRQAKSITIPLQRLAEGTREVAHGNWSHRIEPGGDEETAVLVDSFNQMTADLQQINEELEERRKYVENILTNIAAGVVSLSQNGTVTMLNRAAAGMLGLRIDDVRGKHWSDVFDTSHLRKVAEVIGEALATPHLEVEEQVKLTGGDHIVTALVTATRLTDDAQAPRGLMLFFEDVTHLLRVQRMEAWREVARRLAHEIKNPLTPIQLSAQRLRKRYSAVIDQPDGAVFDECTRTIVAQVEELKRLVNEFSMFARLPAAALAPHDLNGIVEEALVLFRQGHPDIVFEFREGSDLPPLELDREAIKRVLINLLDNAVAACQAVGDTGGRIEVVTTHVPARGVARLEVADNGCGMSREVKLRLFEPYFSTKKEGTGLGLAIVSAIVADHQAYIRVQDNQPRGSRFIIHFPLRGRSEVARAARA